MLVEEYFRKIIYHNFFSCCSSWISLETTYTLAFYYWVLLMLNTPLLFSVFRNFCDIKTTVMVSAGDGEWKEEGKKIISRPLLTELRLMWKRQIGFANNYFLHAVTEMLGVGITLIFILGQVQNKPSIVCLLNRLQPIPPFQKKANLSSLFSLESAHSLCITPIWSFAIVFRVQLSKKFHLSYCCI